MKQVYTFTNGWTMQREDNHAWVARNRYGEEEMRGWNRNDIMDQFGLVVETEEEVPA